MQATLPATFFLIKFLFMKKNILFFLLCLNTTCFSQGLYNNNWCFGDSCGLNFSSSNPLPFNSSLKSQEACASISDSIGNLLFYTNGVRVWDRNHNQMPNGFGLLALPLFPNYGSSACNGSLIIPYPNASNKYLIFTTASSDSGIHYSVVNMSLNGGNGDIELKNFHLYHHPLDEGCTAVRHANGRDWWIIAHKNISDEFYWFLVSPYGVAGPYLQNIGPSFTSDIKGEFDVSSNGTKLLMITQSSIDIYDIDRCEGKLENHESILNFNNGYFGYGGSFSPDGNLSYATIKGDSLFQFNLDDAPDSIYIKRKLIFDNIYYSPTGSNGHPLGSLQLGSDNKLYFTLQYEIMPSNVFDSINTKLSVINFPDSIGSACGLSLNSVDLGGRRCFVDLPNMPNYNLGKLETVLNKSTCAGDAYDFNGEQLSTAGTYHDTLVTVSGGCDSLVTLNLTVINLTASIQQSNDTLSVTSTGSMQWFNCETQQIISGATNHEFVPTQTGNFAAIVTQGNCTDTTACVFYDGVSQLIIDNEQWIIFPNPIKNNVTITSSSKNILAIQVVNILGAIIFTQNYSSPKNKTEINAAQLLQGIYFVRMKTNDGWSAKKFLKE